MNRKFFGDSVIILYLQKFAHQDYLAFIVGKNVTALIPVLVIEMKDFVTSLVVSPAGKGDHVTQVSRYTRVAS